MGVGGFYNNVKPLPRDENGKIKSSFTANGNKYRIISAEEGMSINRWQIFKKYGIEAATGLTMNNLYSKLFSHEDLLKKNSDIYTLSVSFGELKKNLLDLSEERFDLNLYFCSTFIVREGEDLLIWSKAVAEEKIEDWAKEGYSIFDFFFLAVSSDETIKKEFNRLSQKAAATIPDKFLKAYQDYSTLVKTERQKTNT